MSRPSSPRDARGGLAAAVSGLDGAAGAGGSGGGASRASSVVACAHACLRAVAELPPGESAPALRCLRDAAAALLSHAEAAVAAGGGGAGAGVVASAASSPPPRSPARASLLSLEDVAPYIAQAGHKVLAGVLAQVMRSLRYDERVWRAISRAELGLWRRTRLAAAARCGGCGSRDGSGDRPPTRGGRFRRARTSSSR